MVTIQCGNSKSPNPGSQWLRGRTNLGGGSWQHARFQDVEQTVISLAMEGQFRFEAGPGKPGWLGSLVGCEGLHGSSWCSCDWLFPYGKWPWFLYKNGRVSPWLASTLVTSHCAHSCLVLGLRIGIDWFIFTIQQWMIVSWWVLATIVFNCLLVKNFSLQVVRLSVSWFITVYLGLS